ncbi:YolD-like family protein [Ornithinibacillus salinisoli]|uniref:YolD-like family protein n=1 Tax=Ornithinibacillus salinisoli TaxID=1848459 RepID=A0ABW4W3E9_9BACI
MHDRGSIKWTSMMIPEHVKMLQEIRERQNYKQKPVISDYQKEEINIHLQMAIHNDLTIELEYFKDHDYHKIKGKLLSVDVLNQYVNIEDEYIPLDNLTGTWID